MTADVIILWWIAGGVYGAALTYWLLRLLWRNLAPRIRGQRWSHDDIHDMLQEHFRRSRAEFDAITDRWDIATKVGDEPMRVDSERELRANYERYCELIAFRDQVQHDWSH